MNHLERVTLSIHGNIFFILLLNVIVASTAHAEKTDIVVLTTGDRLTGEIKSLNRGKLTYSTDTMETVYIKWDDIVSLHSGFIFEVETTDGALLYGSLAPGTEQGTIAIVFGDQATDIKNHEIVRINRIKKRFWGRVDLKINAGLSFTRGSQVTQFTFGGDFTYRDRQFLVSANGTSIVTTQEEQPTSQNHDLNAGYTRFLQNHYFWGAGGSLEQNTEMGVKLRIVAGGTYGKFGIKTNNTLFAYAGGLVINEEWSFGESDPTSDLEGRIDVDYQYFFYNTPKKDISTKLSIFPSLTSWGRVRTNFDTKFNVELIEDLFWEMHFYYSYDNEPVTEEASNKDYGILTSIAWSL